MPSEFVERPMAEELWRSLPMQVPKVQDAGDAGIESLRQKDKAFDVFYVLPQLYQYVSP